jgi:hypothetical protein
MVWFLNALDDYEFASDELKKKKTVIRINLMNSICMCLKTLRSRTDNLVNSRDYISPE